MKTSQPLTILAIGALVFHLSKFQAQAQFTYTTNRGAITITGYNGPGGDVIIPSVISGLPVVALGNKSFDHRTRVVSLSIPESVTNIGNFVCNHCTDLRSVTIPGSVVDLGGWMFCSCRRLTNATIGNGVTSIGYWEFFWCTGLTQFSIPDTVAVIADGAFYNCSGLSRVTVGKKVAYLGPLAFAECTNLTGIYFSGNAPAADSSAFDGADQAIVYYLPGTVGWGPTFAGRPTAPWSPPSPILLHGSPGLDAQAGASGFTVSWAANKAIIIEAATNLFHPVWTPIATNTLNAGSFYFNDTSQANCPARFYRVRVK